ncbi:unnamed protein product [Diamesa serratosioi]
MKETTIAENLVQRDYNQIDFNIYKNGPGSDLNDTGESKNCKLCLKHVPINLKMSSIEQMVSRYGTVTDIHPLKNKNNPDDKYQLVFVTFDSVSEAEKAMREINQESAGLMNIKASFARNNRKEDINQPIINLPPLPEEPVEVYKRQSRYKLSKRPPITIDLNFNNSMDLLFEKISAFERKKCLNHLFQEELDILKRLSVKSNGFYDVVNQIYHGNPDALTEEFKMLRSGPCNFCQVPAQTSCDKCKSFYCSLYCQKEDWIEHKLKCESISLINKESKEADLKLSDNTISDSSSEDFRNIEPSFIDLFKKGDSVIITALLSENCIYVEPCGLKYKELIQEVAKSVPKAKPFKDEPKKNDYVLVLFMDDYYRAMVLDVDYDAPEDEKTTVLLIDCGNTAKVSVDNLLIMDLKLRLLKRQTFKVFLKDVNLEAINDDIVNYLDSLLANEVELVVTSIKVDEAYTYVELIRADSNENVNQKIKDLNLITEPKYSDPPILSDDMDSVPQLTIGCNIKLFITDVNFLKTGHVGCFLVSKMKDFVEIYKAVNNYAEKTIDQPYNPGTGELCLAFSNNQWHRGILLESKGDGTPVVLLHDLNCFVEVPVEKIRKMPRQLKNPLPMTHLCRIAGKFKVFRIENYLQIFLLLLDFDKTNLEMQQMIEKLVVENNVITVEEITQDKNELFCIHLKEVREFINNKL